MRSLHRSWLRHCKIIQFALRTHNGGTCTRIIEYALCKILWKKMLRG